MVFSIPPFLLYTASWLSIMGGVWALFDRAETVATHETKTTISRWLRNLDPAGSLANLPATFASMFDSIFGKKHFSFRCFGMSCLASSVSVLVISLLWGALQPEEFTALVGIAFETLGFFRTSFVMLFATSVFNFFPCYLSLLETRLVIHWMSKGPSVPRFIILLVFDIFATGVIFLMWIYLYEGWEDWQSLYDIFMFAPPSWIPFPSFGIWFYSAFFTSVWIWLYALSCVAVKLGEYLGLSIGIMKKLFDIENKPLRSLGMISNAIITVLYLFLLLLR